MRHPRNPATPESPRVSAPVVSMMTRIKIRIRMRIRIAVLMVLMVMMMTTSMKPKKCS